jgi:hypothetical protein
MNLNTPPPPRPHPTRRSPANTGASTRKRPGSRGLTRLTSWLIGSALLVLTVAGASTATAAKSTGPRPFSCSNGTGARWHIRHFFFEYDKHGAPAGARLPASGNHYTVSAGGIANCRLAHQWMRRLTSAEPDAGSSGRMHAGFFVPPGEGLLYGEDVPHGFVCAAALDQTNTPDENGDNRHNGFCVTQSHKFAFIWTAAMPSPYKLKPH